MLPAATISQTHFLVEPSTSFYGFPFRQYSHLNFATRPFVRQTDIIVAPILIPPNQSHVAQLSTTFVQPLQLIPSPLRPPCRAEDRIFLWKGVNTAPTSTISDPTIELIATLATCASLRDTSSYGSGLRKFHLFCDSFTIPESDRLPAFFPLLHSFALWTVSDPDMFGPNTSVGIPFEPVSIGVARKYLSAIRAWHIAQGWPPPLTEEDHERINWSLRGLENIQGNRKRPIWPPITISMLQSLRASLNLNDPFEACIWAMSTCAFWSMMRFGEVSVKSHNHFNKMKHIKRCDVLFGFDRDGKHYARLDLPSAKTAKAGEI